MALQTRTYLSPKTSNGFTLVLTVTENSTSTAANTSSLSYSLALKSENYNFSTYHVGWSVSINGSVVSSRNKSNSPQISIGKNSQVTVVSGNVTVAHNADGKKTIPISFSIDMDKQSYTPGPIVVSDQNMTLTTIPRATMPEIPASTVMGNTITINLPRASNNFTHTLTYLFGTASGRIGSGCTTSVSWTVPITLANEIPNAVSGSGTITCETYNGSIMVGTKSVTFKASVPSSVIPVISSVQISETVFGIAERFNNFIQQKSKIGVVTESTGVYNSKISTIKITFDGVSYTGSNIVMNPPQTSGALKVSVAVTDSRGRSATATKEITVLSYASPSAEISYIRRAGEDGSEFNEGEYAAYKVKYNISSLNNLNDALFQIQYKRSQDSNWNILTQLNDFTREINGVSYEEVFNADDSYNARVLIKDYFDTVYIYATDIPTAFTLIDFYKYGIGISFGAVAKSPGMHIHMPLDFYGEPLSDFVVDQGTSGIWTYRKWSSGIAECWGSADFYTKNNLSMAALGNGNGYFYNASENSSWQINFPFEFTVNPVINAIWNGNNFVCLSIYAITANYWLPRFFSPYSDTAQGYVRMHIIGNWK